MLRTHKVRGRLASAPLSGSHPLILRPRPATSLSAGAALAPPAWPPHSPLLEYSERKAVFFVTQMGHSTLRKDHLRHLLITSLFFLAIYCQVNQEIQLVVAELPPQTPTVNLKCSFFTSVCGFFWIWSELSQQVVTQETLRSRKSGLYVCVVENGKHSVVCSSFSRYITSIYTTKQHRSKHEPEFDEVNTDTFRQIQKSLFCTLRRSKSGRRFRHVSKTFLGSLRPGTCATGG